MQAEHGFRHRGVMTCHTLRIAQISYKHSQASQPRIYPVQPARHAPSVAAFIPAHSALIIIEMLLNALQSINDAM